MSNELITILIGAAPISELRGAIPLALGAFGFSPFKAYLLSVFGNILPVIPLLFFFHYISNFLMHRFYFFNRFFSWLFTYTRNRHSNHFDKFDFKLLALFLFVAIPLPLTGAWSGTLAAFVFGISFWRAVAAIFGGIALAGLIVTFISLGIFGL